MTKCRCIHEDQLYLYVPLKWDEDVSLLVSIRGKNANGCEGNDVYICIDRQPSFVGLRLVYNVLLFHNPKNELL